MKKGLDVKKIIEERDEAREWVKRLQKQTQTLTCVYCGKEYPPGTPSHGSSILTDHIKVCEKHPMRKAEETIKILRTALIGLVGAETKEDLEKMELGIRLLPVCDKDKAVTLNAIHAIAATDELI